MCQKLCQYLAQRTICNVNTSHKPTVKNQKQSNTLQKMVTKQKKTLNLNILSACQVRNFLEWSIFWSAKIRFKKTSINFQLTPTRGVYQINQTLPEFYHETFLSSIFFPFLIESFFSVSWMSNEIKRCAMKMTHENSKYTNLK